MSLVAILRHGLRLLLPLAVVQTLYLYLYPIFLGCGFPIPYNATRNGTAASGEPSDGWPAFLETARQHLPIPSNSNATPAPFRLLALGDPQLEGDTSIPNTWGPRFPHWKSLVKRVTYETEHPSLRDRVRQSLHDYIDLLFEDVPNELDSIRKYIDLFGNDFYLAHIYRTVHWWTKPTHVAVLGDLMGSQWIRDDEFERRGARYWDRVFRGTERVPDELMAYPAMEYELAAILGEGEGENQEDAEAWARRAINVAGNHDIGYSGDITRARFDRFERMFGKANYELRFELPVADPIVNATVFDDDSVEDILPPELRIVVLNDMNLDTPVRDSQLQDETYAFLNDVIKTSTDVEYRGHFTIVLTHIPLFKPEGVCVDPPFFSFHDGNWGVKEQNQLSEAASKSLLEGIFGLSGNLDAPRQGLGRPGVVLNGHDHEGCDTYHFISESEQSGDREWEVRRWEDAKANGTVRADSVPGLREITVRSMMGDFGGNAGLLSAWFDEETWSWKFEYATCALGRQHFWWVVHILDLIVLGGGAALVILSALQVNTPTKKATTKASAQERKENGASKGPHEVVGLEPRAAAAKSMRGNVPLSAAVGESDSAVATRP